MYLFATREGKEWTLMGSPICVKRKMDREERKGTDWRRKMSEEWLWGKGRLGEGAKHGRSYRHLRPHNMGGAPSEDPTNVL